MKKVLCFALVVILAIAPMAVFADYDNGNNGYENGYENGNDYGYENGNDNENGNDYENDNEDVTPVYVDDTDEGIEAISIDLAQRWTLGMGDEAYDFEVVTGEVDLDGYVSFDEDGFVVFNWVAPFDGLFYVTGHVVLDNASIHISVVSADLDYATTLAESDEFYELHFELELEEGDTLRFFTEVGFYYTEDGYADSAANWSVVIREVIFLGLEEYEEYEVEEYEEEYEEELLEEVDPLAYVEIRIVGGVEFVRIRAAANAFGFYNMSWDADTYTATIEGLEDYPIVIPEVGGFFDSETWINYVPVAWVLEFFG